MLQELKISNLALMTQTTLEFAEGFTVVTGETGAGKSVLLGALSLLSGARAEKTLIRQGADLLEVEAGLFFEESKRINTVLQSLDLPACEDGVLLLYRSLSRTRMPKIAINGRSTTMAALRTLGESWIDFHGPGEPQKLFSEGRQLEMLDQYARTGELLEAYAKDYRAWRELYSKMEQLRSSERLSPDEVDFFRTQIESIDRAELSEAGIEALELDFSRLSGAEEIISGANSIAHGLNGDNGAGDLLGPLLHTARELGNLNPELATLADRLESLLIELADLGESYEEAARECDFDEEAAEQIRERMNLWLELKRKYGGSIESILARREALAEKIALQGDVEGMLLRLQHEADKQEKLLREQAEVITRKRVEEATTLSKTVVDLLGHLGFKKARFKIEVERLGKLYEYGNSACAFLFAPNAGQDFLPLNKIASSGEVARVMLALKAVLAKVETTPVLVFDEVDANVGGEIAATVGRELAALGQGHQVFCITHLAQVAAQGKWHYTVEKEQSDTDTRVRIQPLHDSPAERVKELARMLGDRNSAAALSHAEELLRA